MPSSPGRSDCARVAHPGTSRSAPAEAEKRTLFWQENGHSELPQRVLNCTNSSHLDSFLSTTERLDSITLGHSHKCKRQIRAMLARARSRDAESNWNPAMQRLVTAQLPSDSPHAPPMPQKREKLLFNPEIQRITEACPDQRDQGRFAAVAANSSRHPQDGASTVSLTQRMHAQFDCSLHPRHTDGWPEHSALCAGRGIH